MKKILLNLLILFSLISTVRAQVPNTQDCFGAIAICTNKYETVTSYSGTGNFPNEIDWQKTCLKSGEKNDVWYVFTVQKSGNLSFTITPKDGKDDYDWAVFNLTNASCSEIFNDASLIVSCDYAANMGCGGLTGPNGNIQPVEGSSSTCWQQNKAVIPVLEGETYVINVSNYSSSQSGYTIDFSASTADIFDKSAPKLQSLSIPQLSSVSEVSLKFSEKLLCSSLQPSDFILTGPDGNHTITAISGGACSLGASADNTFQFSVSPAIQITGTYTLQLNGSINDQCGNTANSGSISAFYCKPGIKPVISATSSATICPGGNVKLTADLSAVQWLRNNVEIPGATSKTYTATTAGSYTARPISDCTLSDAIKVTVLSSLPPTPVISTPGGTYLCNGGSLILKGQSIATRWFKDDVVIAEGESISVSLPGTYKAVAFNACGESPKSSPVIISINPLAYKKSRFDDAVLGDIGSDTSAMLEESRTMIADQVKTACEAGADGWIERLAPGLKGRADSATLCDELKLRLIEVCMAGGDIDHPNGSSTAPAATASGFSSFGEVIKGVLNISDYTADLNPWLIDSPYPYNAKAQATDVQVSVTDSMLCDKLQTLKTQHLAVHPELSFFNYLKNTYKAEMTLREEELDILLKSCNSCNYILKEDIRLPVFMQVATKGCISADEYDDAVAALDDEFGSHLNPSHENYPLIFENFLNHRFGFTLTYDVYKAYSDTIALSAQRREELLCNRPPFEDLELDGYEPVKNLMAVSVANALRQYDEYILDERRRFKNSYVNLCASAKPDVKLSTEQRTYQYTLYYYDQADNLLRTVPPEGVTLLESNLLPWVAEARDNSCTYDGPMINSDKTEALTKLSGVLSVDQGRAIEMWLYNAGISNKIFTAATPDKKYLVQAGFDSGKLNVSVFSLKPDSVQEDAISIVRSNYATAVLGSASIKQYTHLLIQSDSLAKGALQLYVNGTALQVLPDSLSNGTGFAISGSGNLPESLVDIKQLRYYSRKLSGGEIATNASSLCFAISPSSKLALLGSPKAWYRFNVPAESALNIAGENINERFVSPIYPDHKLATTYTYNSTNQVVKQHTPDGGYSRFWYDNLSRLVVSQNDKQLKQKDFSYTVYDKLGRIAEVGQKNFASSGLKEPQYLDSLAYRNFLSGGSNSQIVQTYYDTIPAPGSGIIPLEQDNLRKRVALSAYRETAASPVSQATYYNYDLTGNVTTLWQQIYGLGLKKIDYEFDLVSGKVNFVRYQQGQPDEFYYKYKYDAENRLTEAWSGTKALYNPIAGSYLLNGKQDARYEYYLHGPLARVELGDQYSQVQGLDYAYTLQGWLKGVNSQRLNASEDIGKDGLSGSVFPKDVYAYSLGYYKDDYKPIGAGVAPAFGIQYQAQNNDIAGQNLYNGNISNSTLAISQLPGSPLTGYTYRYDQLNRLTQMRQHPIEPLAGTWGNASESYKENISYDANGNILSYFRNGAGNRLAMDNLSYTYNRDSQGRLLNNRLVHVKDAVSSDKYTEDMDSQPDSNYVYDEIGNLVKDTQEGINAIDWTVFGKIKNIQKSNGKSVSYAYDPAGNRVSKTVNGLMTWYVRDAQGNTLGVYDNQNCVANWREQQLYGSSRLGIWKPNRNLYAQADTTAWDSVGNKYYELSNHLGNVLAVVSNKKFQVAQDSLIDRYEAELVSAQDYYPFGMVQPGRTYGLDGGNSKKTFTNTYPCVLCEEFDNNSAEGWNTVQGNISLNVSAGRMAMATSSQWSVAGKVFNTIPGQTYTVKYDVDFGNNYYMEMVLKDDNGTFLVWNPSSPYFYKGSAPADFTFTATTAKSHLYIGNGGFVNTIDTCYIKYIRIQQATSVVDTLVNAIASYRYGFNGKENDNEVKGDGNQQDYGMRIYDPRLGRFFSVDPLTKTYPELTPFQYASNRPIDGVDVDGQEWGTFTYKVIKDAKGRTAVQIIKEQYLDDWLSSLGGKQLWLKPDGAKKGQYGSQGIPFKSFREMWAAAKLFASGQANFDENYNAHNKASGEKLKQIILTDIALNAHQTFVSYVDTKIALKGAAGASVAANGRNLGTLGEQSEQALNVYGTVKSGNLPGSSGAYLGGSRLTNQQMEALTEQYRVEFAQVYTPGSGKNGGGGYYTLYSGSASSVSVPIGPNSFLVNHTHPGGTPYPSTFDIDYLLRTQRLGSPQKSSVILPTGGQPVRFNNNTSTNGQ